MGLELDLSELAVIRSIRTAASSADAAAPTLQPAGSKGELVDDDVGTGCVTPTAAAVMSSMPAGPSGVVVDVDVAGCDVVSAPTPISAVVLAQGGVDEDDTGCVTPTAATGGPMTPRRGAAAVVVVVDAVCATPTSAASVLRPSMECPPAPRKPARSPVVPKRKRPGGAPRPCFFPVPRDLTKVFVARGPADSSPPQQGAAKKIRVHPVG